jgi:hypothetical protein
VQPEAVAPPWRNYHQYTVSMGGPIVKSKTFFFALWDGFLPKNRTDINATILTPCARNGVFRYFDNWSNGNALQTTGSHRHDAANRRRGLPGQPDPARDKSEWHARTTAFFAMRAFTGLLRVTQPKPIALTRPCREPRGTASGTQRDPSGYMTQLLGVMPTPNNYEVGDGLNTAGYRWVLTRTGADNRFGFGEPVNRKQLNVKIDHNFQ